MGKLCFKSHGEFSAPFFSGREAYNEGKKVDMNDLLVCGNRRQTSFPLGVTRYYVAETYQIAVFVWSKC